MGAAYPSPAWTSQWSCRAGKNITCFGRAASTTRRVLVPTFVRRAGTPRYRVSRCANASYGPSMRSTVSHRAISSPSYSAYTSSSGHSMLHNLRIAIASSMPPRGDAPQAHDAPPTGGRAVAPGPGRLCPLQRDIEVQLLTAQPEADAPTGRFRNEVHGLSAGRGVAPHQPHANGHATRGNHRLGAECDGTVHDGHFLARARLPRREPAADGDLHPNHAPLAQGGRSERVQQRRLPPRDPGPPPVGVFLPQRQPATRPTDQATRERHPSEAPRVRLREGAEQALELRRATPQREPQVRLPRATDRGAGEQPRFARCPLDHPQVVSQAVIRGLGGDCKRHADP